MHEDVGILDQPPGNGNALWRLEIECDAALVAIGCRVVVTHRIMEVRRPGPAVVADLGSLDLDDVSAIVAQHHGAKRAGHGNADLDHLDAGQG